MSQNNVKIYLIGYPKSGTTWLTKLLAHALNILVEKKKNENVPSYEINDRLGLKFGEGFIIKSHDLPKVFFNTVNSNPERIIYIRRDMRAAFISAFFYFKVPKRFSFLFLLEPGNHLSFIQKLQRFFCLPFSRWYLHKELKIYIKQGVIDGSIGRWDEHIRLWENEAQTQKKACLYSFITYETLLDDTTGSLRQILKDLDLQHFVSEKELQTSVEEESFDKMKSRLNRNSAPTDHSKLRVGKKDDWKNYLSKSNLKRINEYLSSATKE